MSGLISHSGRRLPGVHYHCRPGCTARHRTREAVCKRLERTPTTATLRDQEWHFPIQCNMSRGQCGPM